MGCTKGPITPGSSSEERHPPLSSLPLPVLPVGADLKGRRSYLGSYPGTYEVHARVPLVQLREAQQLRVGVADDAAVHTRHLEQLDVVPGVAIDLGRYEGAMAWHAL